MEEFKMLVYEIVNNHGRRLIYVKKESIARELCLVDMELAYRPLYVAEDLGGAKIDLREKRGY